MAKHFSSRLLTQWLRLFHRKRSIAGFTLIELLVAMFIGSIITSVLLYGVVELLKTNQRESSRAETQREMQLALDYVSAELRQAVFVYDGRCLSRTGTGAGAFSATDCPGVTSFLPTAINNSPSTVPVLAFWKVEDLPQVLINLCAANAANLNLTTNANPPTGINGVPCLSRRTYSLVVYYLDTTNSGNTWAGKARLKRYALTQYKSDGSPNTGWVDPTTTINKFLGWPFDATGTNLQTAATLSDGSTNQYQGAITSASVTPPVLVDFVDTPTAGSTANACPGDSSSSGNLPPFVRSPTDTTITSFYTCVRGGGFNTSGTTYIPNNTGGRNQEVAVFVRGNAAGRSGVPSTANVVFDLQTRVLSRGSFEKSPAAQ